VGEKKLSRGKGLALGRGGVIRDRETAPLSRFSNVTQSVSQEKKEEMTAFGGEMIDHIEGKKTPSRRRGFF